MARWNEMREALRQELKEMQRCQAAKEPAGMTLLIVEDSAVVRDNLGEWLRAVFPQVRVAEAASGEEAVAFARESFPDLVLMDVGLPGISGMQAVRQIKAIRPKSRVAMLTICEDAEYRREAEQAGADAYLFKRRMASDLIPALQALMTGTGEGGMAAERINVGHSEEGAS